MCNCNNKRNALSTQSNSLYKSAGQKVQVPVQKTESVMFKYTGRTGLTVVGNVTRRNYRFNFPGDTQPIEQADAPGMLTVPVLQRIS